MNFPTQSILYILFLAHDVNIIIILRLLPMMFPFRPHSEVISGFLLFLPQAPGSPGFFSYSFFKKKKLNIFHHIALGLSLTILAESFLQPLTSPWCPCQISCYQIPIFFWLLGEVFMSLRQKAKLRCAQTKSVSSSI